MAGDIVVRPVGAVRILDDGRQAVEIAPEYADGLHGIESLEHIWVLYWMHELPPAARARLRGHPYGDRARPERGVFALHSPFRPNPIGMTRVRLLGREGNRLIVEGLDALDGSPVIDIKSA
jgi:tRNA-Thr(GGU) m(6)t(6)A37 methyltransferase TsaA